MEQHWSDCAVYNEPESPNRPCDCGGLELSENLTHPPVVLRITRTGGLASFLDDVHRKRFVEGHHLPANRLVADATAPNLIDPHARVSSGRDADRMDFNDTDEAVIL